MKLVITGSLGNISRPLAQELVQKGHSVTVISSKAERRSDIEALGAQPAIGTVDDVQFLTASFRGADAVYTMLPPPDFANAQLDFRDRSRKIGENYVQAIREADVKQVVHLSSIGAHTDQGNGILLWAYQLEQTLNELPTDVAITFMRPVGFYYNLLGFINGIKTQGIMASNYGADDIIPWVSPKDIAVAVAQEMVTPSTSRKVRYIASDLLSCQEVARILGTAIGKPELTWIVIPDEQLLSDMKTFGLSDYLAEGFVEMNAAMHNGTLFDDYYRHQPALGQVKLTDYSQEFAAAYHQS